MIRLGAGDVGRRVVVRHALPDGRATDVLGTLESWGPEKVAVRRADGALVVVHAAAVLAGKPVPPAPVRVRPAVVDDAAAIETLRVTTWQAAYRGMIPDGFLDAMPIDVERRASLLRNRREGTTEVVATAGSEVVGWAVGSAATDDDLDPAAVGEIFACYVAPDWWGAGVGGRVLRRVLAGLAAGGRAEVALWVLEANEQSRRFYASYGFLPDGHRQALDLGGPVAAIRCVRRGGIELSR